MNYLRLLKRIVRWQANTLLYKSRTEDLIGFCHSHNIKTQWPPPAHNPFIFLSCHLRHILLSPNIRSCYVHSFFSYYNVYFQDHIPLELQYSLRSHRRLRGGQNWLNSRFPCEIVRWDMTMPTSAFL